MDKYSFMLKRLGQQLETPEQNAYALAVEIREYGTDGPLVLVLHGGPGAAGYMSPVAEALAGGFSVLEPMQRRAGPRPLRVADHVEDLLTLVLERSAESPPSMVGHSWGAMLALAFAAAHPDLAGPLALVGCGCFDDLSRAEMGRIVQERLDGPTQRKLRALPEEVEDPDRRLCAMGDLLLPAYSFDIDPEAPAGEAECDARAHEETWRDMARLMRRGVYPASFSAVASPVFMLHGDTDPHPGRMIRDGLSPHLPRIEYRELPKCGHYPWLERHAAREFHWRLASWLERYARKR